MMFNLRGHVVLLKMVEKLFNELLKEFADFFNETRGMNNPYTTE